MKSTLEKYERLTSHIGGYLFGAKFLELKGRDNRGSTTSKEGKYMTPGKQCTIQGYTTWRQSPLFEGRNGLSL